MGWRDRGRRHLRRITASCASGGTVTSARDALRKGSSRLSPPPHDGVRPPTHAGLSSRPAQTDRSVARAGTPCRVPHAYSPRGRAGSGADRGRPCAVHPQARRLSIPWPGRSRRTDPSEFTKILHRVYGGVGWVCSGSAGLRRPIRLPVGPPGWSLRGCRGRLSLGDRGNHCISPLAASASPGSKGVSLRFAAPALREPVQHRREGFLSRQQSHHRG